MQTASSRVWTQVSDTISYNDNHYTKHAYSIFVYMLPQHNIFVSIVAQIT